MTKLRLNNQTTSGTPPQFLKKLIEDILNQKAVHWAIPDCGLSSALRYSVVLEDKSKVFVKAATDNETEKWLRNTSVRNKLSIKGSY